MTEKPDKEKLETLYRELCINFVGGLRALALYPKDHPDTKKKVDKLYQQFSNYLKRSPVLTLLIVGGDIVVENIPLPDLGKTLSQFIGRMEDTKIQRLVFQQGLDRDELVLFLQALLILMKKPDDAFDVLAKYRGRMPHIMAGAISADPGSPLTEEALPHVPQVGLQSFRHFSKQVKVLLGDVEGPLLGKKVSMAKEITEAVHRMGVTGEMPLKVLIYRRGTDSDPYTHAVNVCALSMELAREIDLEEECVLEVGLGALLHDIGLHLPFNEPLSDTAAISFEERQRRWEHPIHGSDILLATPELPDLVPLVAYEHHIHYDGGGYPKHTRPRGLNLASMITCITNSYDNLRRDRPEHSAMSLTDVINRMDRSYATRYHPILLKKFRAMVKAQAEEDIGGA